MDAPAPHVRPPPPPPPLPARLPACLLACTQEERSKRSAVVKRKNELAMQVSMLTQQLAVQATQLAAATQQVSKRALPYKKLLSAAWVADACQVGSHK